MCVDAHSSFKFYLSFFFLDKGQQSFLLYKDSLFALGNVHTEVEKKKGSLKGIIHPTFVA